MNKLDLNKKLYIITVSPPYVNSMPHVGYAFEVFIGDTISRYLRFLNKNVFFVSSTDDNSFKLAEAARKVGLGTQSFVDKFASEFKGLKDKLTLSYDNFYRTSSDYHADFVNSFIEKIDTKYTYKDRFKSYFCVECEQFFGLDIPEPKICSIHNKPYLFLNEENYFIKITNEDKILLKEKLKTKSIYPDSAFLLSKEIISKFSNFNFTVNNNYNWGLVLKKNPEYIFYSSFDAVLGYLGACVEMNKDWLSEDTCVIQNFGIDILKFHSVYLPFILLKSNILHTADYLLAHGLININGVKMSKSKNNTVTVDELLKRFHSDSLRLYLLKHNLFIDFDYNEEELISISKVHNKFIDQFLPNIKNNINKINSIKDVFDYNICNFNFKENIDKFIYLIKENEVITDLNQDHINFLTKFLIIFLPATNELLY